MPTLLRTHGPHNANRDVLEIAKLANKNIHAKLETREKTKKYTRCIRFKTGKGRKRCERYEEEQEI